MIKNFLQHDYGSRNNQVLQQIRRKHGMEGVGIYWCITEQLFELGGEMPLDYDLLSFELRSDISVISGVVDIAFSVSDDKIYSEWIITELTERLESYNKKIEGKSKAGIASGLSRKSKALLKQSSNKNEQVLNKDEHVFDCVEQENPSVEQNELSKDKISIDKLSEVKISDVKESEVKISNPIQSEENKRLVMLSNHVKEEYHPDSIELLQYIFPKQEIKYCLPDKLSKFDYQDDWDDLLSNCIKYLHPDLTDILRNPELRSDEYKLNKFKSKLNQYKSELKIINQNKN